MIWKGQKRPAILGGDPAFDRVLHVGRPRIPSTDKLQERLNNVLEQARLTNNGPMVQELESRLKEHTGTRHCVAVCNATVGLEIASKALGMQGQVIVPSMTFIATAHSLQWNGIEPVFCDIEKTSHNIDPHSIEGLIGESTGGIIGVHLWGKPCDVLALQNIASRHNIPLLFDAAHAFGCSTHGRMIGGFGDAEVFSFHATKFLSTLEGGAIATDDDELARKIRLMRNFGFDGLDNVISVGTNGKMHEFSAAFGLTALDDLSDMIENNKRINTLYFDKLRYIKGIEPLDIDGIGNRNYQYLVLEINKKEFGMSRDMLMRVLHAENVRARRYFYPGCHRMEPYRTLYPEYQGKLPRTEFVLDRVLCLPTGSQMSRSDVLTVCNLIDACHENSGELVNLLNVNDK